MTLTLQKWPSNWDVHILKYCDLYFCDKDIKYLSRNFWTETLTNRPDDLKVTSINMKFKIADYYYMVNVSNNENTFTCNVFYRRMVDNFSDNKNNILICCVGDVSLLQEIDGIGGYGMTSSCLMEFAEQTILSDYNQRQNNDWDNEDEENNPIKPFCPTEVISPELVLI